ESNLIGAVANRVKCDLESGAVALDRHLRKRRRIEAQDTGRCGIIGVRCEERRCSRAERAVDQCLQCTGLQPWIGRTAAASHCFEASYRESEREPFGDADLLFSVAFQLLKD